MMFDICFLYRQFLSKTGDMPKSFEEFVKLWKVCFPAAIYDTKVFSQHCGRNVFSQTDLLTVYKKCCSDKKLRNNIQIDFDQKDARFSQYSQQGHQQQHDAGYDSFMTGLAYICIAKYIEIGNIIPPKAVGEEQKPPSATKGPLQLPKRA